MGHYPEHVTAPYPKNEEIANTISHGIGAIFGIVALILLLIKAGGLQASAIDIASYAVYGSSIIVLFLASSVYHGISNLKAKYWLKKIDHSAIFLLIAGTYTPFLLVGLGTALAHTLFWVIWGIAIVGVIFKLFFAHRFERLSLTLYLVMGWLSLIIVYQMAIYLPWQSIALLAGGGVLYTVGTYFYAKESIKYGHAIWHLFVLGGCVLHFWGIYAYI